MIKGFIILSFLFMSFFNFQDSSKIEDLLIGVWVYDTTQKGETAYRKSKAFLYDLPGIEFKTDGKLLIRVNSSRCGTPPITYSKYEGSWKILDSTIIIKSKYWGGDMKQAWEILGITPTKLTVMNYGSIAK